MADASPSSPKILYPGWQHEFRAALLELDTEKLRERVAAAETAIFNRLRAISHSSDTHAERQAIQDALEVRIHAAMWTFGPDNGAIDARRTELKQKSDVRGFRTSLFLASSPPFRNRLGQSGLLGSYARFGLLAAAARVGLARRRFFIGAWPFLWPVVPFFQPSEDFALGEADVRFNPYIRDESALCVCINRLHANLKGFRQILRPEYLWQTREGRKE